MSKLIYELRPYIYGTLAVYAVFLSKYSVLMLVSGSMMAISCVWVSYLRYTYRKSLAEMTLYKQYITSKNKELNDKKFNIY